jgi:adenylate kinase family enzyme
MRIHIFGASGSGTSTLGRALAERAGVAFLDTDDFFWEPSDPPYQRARPEPQRLRELRAALAESRSWVLAGSLCGWADPLIPRFELVVFLQLATSVRIARLRARESAKFGAAALAPGGAMHRDHEEFIDWARSYDHGGLDMRSFARHETWLSGLPCPTLSFEGEGAVDDRVAQILAATP